ncbi:MAG TPA: PDGLE domain-containing protein, partial [Candidatus Brocadiales bacterium]|nr:PDGLE domain-containing protein [Candidatus Brocadiales bacterium]
GLEWVAEKLGFIEKERQIVTAPLADYGIPIVKGTRISTALAGIAGTLIVFCITTLFLFVLKKKGA